MSFRHAQNEKKQKESIAQTLGDHVIFIIQARIFQELKGIYWYLCQDTGISQDIPTHSLKKKYLRICHRKMKEEWDPRNRNKIHI